jgi:hypothetical protein
MFALPAFDVDRLWCFWASPANSAAERPPLGGVCAPCAVVEGSHPAFLCTFVVYFIVFVLLLFLGLFVVSFAHVHPCFGD